MMKSSKDRCIAKYAKDKLWKIFMLSGINNTKFNLMLAVFVFKLWKSFILFLLSKLRGLKSHGDTSTVGV